MLGMEGEAIGDGDDGANAEEILDAPEEESDQKRVLPTPEMPSLSEVLKHREDHVPYMCWCDHCVEGRGREMGHGRADMEIRSVPTIAFDYMFINDKGAFTADELAAIREGDRGDGIKALVVKDTKSRMLFAHVVPSKGVDEDRYAVEALTSDIAWLGYTRVIFEK